MKSGSLHGAERALADKEAELAKLMAELGERSIMADGQRVQLAAQRAQVEAMKVSVADYERAVRVTEERLGRERTEAEAAAGRLNQARGKLGELATRTAELERQLMVQKTEAEVLNRRAQELEARLGDQGRQLTERQVEVQRLRADLKAAKKIENDLREELSHAGIRSSGAVNKFRADIVQLEAQLAAALEERAKLQGEIASMRRDTESTWAAERVENALLRERINDVAAEVARLTAALEGPNSPIELILALGTAAIGKGTGDLPGTNGARAEASATIESPQQGKGTLADRIRALQSTASRASN